MLACVRRGQPAPLRSRRFGPPDRLGYLRERREASGMFANLTQLFRFVFQYTYR